jgi:hypothetical protein
MVLGIINVKLQDTKLLKQTTFNIHKCSPSALILQLESGFTSELSERATVPSFKYP